MIFAGNFKSNLTRKKCSSYINALNSFLVQNSINTPIFLLLPPTLLDRYINPINLKVGAQNFYPDDSGAYTGEVCGEHLEEFSIRTVLIGHSERRILFGEDSEFLKKKLDFAINKGYNIIYCVGEPQEVNSEGSDKIFEYIKEQLSIVDLSYKKMTIAYEPIWAIGSGKIPTLNAISDISELIKSITNLNVLYGGSVNLTNIDEITDIANCDGVLVGGASLDVEVTKDMIAKLKYK